MSKTTEMKAEPPLPRLLARIKDRSAIVGVVGLGYVGLPLAVEKAKVGYRVVGIEQNPERARMVNAGQSFVRDVDSSELARLTSSGKIEARTGFGKAEKMDVVVICVPTPLTSDRKPDLSYVTSVTEELAKHLRPGQLVSLESTTYPGTTHDVLMPLLESSGLKADEDFFLAHSPERVDPGNARYTTKNISKVVGGIGPRSLEAAVAFYSQTIQNVVPVSSANAAELVKTFENTFRAVNIALVNEMALLCDRLGLDVWEVLDAAFTKPFGILPFYPGPGVGGHCIPIDPHYLEWRAKESGFETRFIALAAAVNSGMPAYVRDRVVGTLDGLGVAPNGAKVLQIGMAYKNDLPDVRESPAIQVFELLQGVGAVVTYHDPHVPTVRIGDADVASVPLTQDALSGADIVVIATNHSAVDYDFVVKHARHVFDTRNATRGVRKGRGKITLL